MKIDQANSLIKRTFQEPYSDGDYLIFIKNLLPNIDTTEAIFHQSVDNNIHIKSFSRLGVFEDNQGEIIDVLSVEVNSGVTLKKTRTAIRNFAVKNMIEDICIVAFHSREYPNWRFSLIVQNYDIQYNPKTKKTKTIKNISEAKRFSWLVGENEPSHTAQQQISPLLVNDNVVLDDIVQAFSIEAVTDEFYDQYRNYYRKLNKSLEFIVSNDASIAENFDQNEINTKDFSKKIMGQIVFCYFLQRKGWLGTEDDTAWKGWGDGDRRFIYNLFNKKMYKGVIKYCDYDNFFNDILEPLFYEGFGKKNPDDYLKKIQCKIPFLNGGLFEPINGYDWKKTDIVIDNNIFKSIIDIFDRFNFTVREDDDLDIEVAVDPEMLGKVFENLIEDNEKKKDGVWYTPRQTVKFMVDQALISFLVNSVEDYVSSDNIFQLINSLKIDDLKKPQIETIDHYLKNIKICDPAIGSGAFAIGLADKIVKVRLILNNSTDKYFYKKHVITESIYGVDIDAGAIEIAKLRLFLFLTVDTDVIEKIEPLPNLDFKIMQGNSLVEDFHGVILDINKKMDKQGSIFEDISMEEKLISDLHNIQMIYLNESDFDKKLFLKNKIEKAIKDIFLFKCKEKSKLIDVSKIKEDIERTFETQIFKPFFFWKLYFSDVFYEKGGFDIVIGNPPYVEARHSDFSDKMKIENQRNVKLRWGEEGLKHIGRGSDLLIYFFELALHISHSKTPIVFVASNAWLSTMYGKKFQNFLLKKTYVSKIIDSDFKIFSSANINAVISIFIGNKPVKDHKKTIQLIKFHSQNKNINLSKISDENKEVTIKEYDYSSKIIYEKKWEILSSTTKDILSIIEKGEKKGLFLNEITACEVRKGQGLNEKKKSFIDYEIIKNESFPYYNIASKGENGNFSITSTDKVLIEQENRNLVPAGILPDDFIFFKRTSRREIPVLILPRGITKHYCALNEINAFSDSCVDIYDNSSNMSEEMKMNFWLFFNSSFFWLIRESSGRKNLGGGLLKSESADLDYFKLYYQFEKLEEIKIIYNSLKNRIAYEPLEEINSKEHKDIDQIVFQHFDLSESERNLVLTELNKLITARSTRASS